MKTKVCLICEKDLSVTKFSKGNGEFGLSSWCKVCCREYNKQYRETHKEKLKKQQREYRQTDRGRDVKRKADKKYRESEKGKEASRRGEKKYRQTKRGKKVNKKQYEENKLSKCVSGAIRRSLKQNKSGRHWETLVPYTLKDLKQHFEKLFQSGMSWDNYGLFGWHIDHKVPVSSFNITSCECEDFEKCWALENLQPLWAEENLSKGARI